LHRDPSSLLPDFSIPPDADITYYLAATIQPIAMPPAEDLEISMLDEEDVTVNVRLSCQIGNTRAGWAGCCHPLEATLAQLSELSPRSW
jgi:hypothetical protein